MDEDLFTNGKTPLDFPLHYNIVRKQCEFCNRWFWTNRPGRARFCNKTSSCRVNFHKRKREQQHQEALKLIAEIKAVRLQRARERALEKRKQVE